MNVGFASKYGWAVSVYLTPDIAVEMAGDAPLAAYVSGWVSFDLNVGDDDDERVQVLVPGGSLNRWTTIAPVFGDDGEVVGFTGTVDTAAVITAWEKAGSPLTWNPDDGNENTVLDVPVPDAA